MITIKDFMECVSYTFTESSPFLWSCFGSTSQYIDADTISIVADIKTQQVYSMEAWDEVNLRFFRYIAPDFREAYKNECASRVVDYDFAFDGIDIIDLETENDILVKSKAIFNKEEYDPRIEFDLKLEKEEIKKLENMAKENNTTIDKVISSILTYVFNEEQIIERLKGHE